MVAPLRVLALSSCSCVTLAFLRLASLRMVSCRSASLRSAPGRSASNKLAPDRLVPLRSAPGRSAEFRWAPLRLASNNRLTGKSCVWALFRDDAHLDVPSEVVVDEVMVIHNNFRFSLLLYTACLLLFGWGYWCNPLEGLADQLLNDLFLLAQRQVLPWLWPALF